MAELHCRFDACCLCPLTRFILCRLRPSCVLCITKRRQRNSRIDSNQILLNDKDQQVACLHIAGCGFTPVAKSPIYHCPDVVVSIGHVICSASSDTQHCGRNSRHSLRRKPRKHITCWAVAATVLTATGLVYRTPIFDQPSPSHKFDLP